MLRSIVRVITLAALATGFTFVGVQPASAATSPNLVRNPGADLAPGGSPTGADIDIPMWGDIYATAVKYDTPRFFPTSSTPGPANRGTSFFYGGSFNGDSQIQQIADISKYATKINAGGVKISVVAWLGGIGNNNDVCNFNLKLVNQAETAILKRIDLTGPTAFERGGQTKFLKRSATVAVPKLTRKMSMEFRCDSDGTGANTGIADSLVVKFLNV